MTKRPPPSGALVPLDDEELEEAPDDVRHAEAWYLVATGHTQTDVAKTMGVTRQTIANWLKSESLRRRSRVENIDEEAERLVGILEGVVAEAWKSHRRAGENSMAGPSYLKTVLDGVKEIASLRGLDRRPTDDGAGKKTEIIVRIGGGPSAYPDAIEVGVRKTA